MPDTLQSSSSRASAHKPVTIALERAPTIAGHIQNESGEPVANILVQALKGVYGTDGKRSYTPFAATLSDDHGEYRLYWLDPGEYIVSASFVAVVKTPGNPIYGVPQVVYAPTLYPGASDLANAQRITLKADQNDLTRDFRLVKALALSVRGSTTTNDNRRAPLVTVTLSMAGDSTGAARYTARSSEDGLFEIKNVAPGSYIATTETVVGKERYAAARHIVVYDHDENNVGLILSPGIPVSGKIGLDSGGPVSLQSTRAQLTTVDPFMESFSTVGFQPNGQFVIRYVQPGHLFARDYRNSGRPLYSVGALGPGQLHGKCFRSWLGSASSFGNSSR
jgi:hypothetical protein